MKRVIILGATGSIGVQALQVVAACGNITVVGLSVRPERQAAHGTGDGVGRGGPCHR